MKPHPWLIVVMAGALVGVVFAGLSTYDFVQHLDRQVHSLHCSFVPGAGAEAGASGCQVAMMSEYSSVLRSRVWGGVPIALPAMAVFSFLGLFAIDLLLARRQRDVRATAFLALAAGLPAVVSVIMLTISLAKLGTTCTLCVAIYVASAACLVGAIALWRRAVKDHAIGGGGDVIARRAPARRTARDERGGEPAFTGTAAPEEAEPVAAPAGPELRVAEPGVSNGFLAAAFGVGVAFVLLPVLVYLAIAPDHGRFVGTCDGLPKPNDTYNIMVRVDRGGGGGGVPAIEVLDPLCPACAAFEDRLVSSGYADELDRKAVLFPLDNTCNWMVTEATHPGACAVSEAVLCAGDKAPEVIAWAFAEQERVRAAAKQDPGAAARMVRERFPQLGACVGSPEAKARLNKSLRWAVANNLRVLTPQLFVANVKLCDEDVDLGLEYSMRVMLDRYAAKTLKASTPEAPAPADAPAAAPAAPDPAPPADRPKKKPAKKKPSADDAPDKSDRAAEPSPDRPDTKPDRSDTPSEPPPPPPPPDKPADTPPDKPITSPSQVPGGTP